MPNNQSKMYPAAPTCLIRSFNFICGVSFPKDLIDLKPASGCAFAQILRGNRERMSYKPASDVRVVRFIDGRAHNLAAAGAVKRFLHF